MKQLTVNASTQYNIYIGSNLITDFNNKIHEIYNGKKIYIVTDSNVSKLYLNKVIDSLVDYECQSVVFEAGESSKNIDVYQNIIEELINLDITRKDLVVALGGGVVGDITGFVCSTLYRGIAFVQIPTTLLAMVDSSIGGKTAIDFLGHKNIIGAFKQPEMVLIDLDFLKTLDLNILKSGYGEIIKHALLEDEELFKKLEQLDDVRNIDEDLIYQNLKIKASYVEADEFDNGKRMKLNLGHTFGHIIEINNNMLHGDAILSGILCILDLEQRFHIDCSKLKQRILDLYKKLDLNYIEENYMELIPEIFYDKKYISGKINFIFVRNFGNTIIFPVAKIQLCAL